VSVVDAEINDAHIAYCRRFFVVANSNVIAVTQLPGDGSTTPTFHCTIIQKNTRVEKSARNLHHRAIVIGYRNVAH
jgi:hypothetical protein